MRSPDMVFPSRLTIKQVLIGNEKLMKKEGIAYTPCQSGGTVVYVACDGKFAGTHGDF